MITVAFNVFGQQTIPFAETRAQLEKELRQKYGDTAGDRLVTGMKQVASLWRSEDGSETDFADFVRTQFAGTETDHNALFSTLEEVFHKVEGHMLEIGLALRWQVDLDSGPILPAHEILAGYEPSAHLNDDFFANKLAFVVLLNFKLSSLDEALAHQATWTRRDWAELRLAQRFASRVPAEVNLEIGKASAEASQYIAEYNIWMHHILSEKGERLFPKGMKLLSHWNLRDQIKADYADKTNGLEKQLLIQKVMGRIITQTIPAIVVNNPRVDWNPFTNEVKISDVIDFDEKEFPAITSVNNNPEGSRRYEMLLKTFRASRLVDPYSPSTPTLIDRRFQLSRQIPEEQIEKMLTDVISSPMRKDVAKIIEQRLGRTLRPFDIWYNGFKPKSKYSEEDLDVMVAKRYPDAKAFKDDLPVILKSLGFADDRAAYLAKHIDVDPARGSGHAWGALLRGASARLRTRIGKEGMNYKGFNIAIHELGHNVEQTFSLNDVDHWLLQGVPNTAFTEAIAFLFQANDLKVLGLSQEDPEAEALKTLNDFWATAEIAGVALLDMRVWRWMYQNPDANADQLKEAVIRLAKEIWNTYYAEIFGKQDVPLLAVYSHMIDSFLYLPDYPIGHLIAHQVEEHIRKTGNLGAEVERMTTIGNILPDMWMQKATGSKVGAEALLDATERALHQMEEK